MEQTTNIFINAFCIGVFFGPMVWACIWLAFNIVFKLFDWLDAKFSKDNTDFDFDEKIKELHKNISNLNNENK